MRCLLLLVLALGCASCSNTVKPASVATPIHIGPVIARIAGRHDTIIIRAGESGPTYSLETVRGEVVVPDMSLGKLAAANPPLFKRINMLQDSLLMASTRD